MSKSQRQRGMASEMPRKHSLSQEGVHSRYLDNTKRLSIEGRKVNEESRLEVSYVLDLL
jgi:hypothetical protein